MRILAVVAIGLGLLVLLGLSTDWRREEAGLLWGPITCPEVDELSYPTNVAFILDASHSMNKTIDGTSRLKVAKAVLTELLGLLPDGIQVRLSAYGHRVPRREKEESCMDIERFYRFQPLDSQLREAIISSLVDIEAKGLTPIADALVSVGNDLKNLEGTSVIVLVSDGEETCGGDPRAAARFLADMPNQVALNIIGLDVEPVAQAMLRSAAATTGGQYRDVRAGTDLCNVLYPRPPSLPLGPPPPPDGVLRPPDGVLPSPDGVPLLPDGDGAPPVKVSVDPSPLEKTLPELLVYHAKPEKPDTPPRELFGTNPYVEVGSKSGGIFCADLDRLWADSPESEEPTVEVNEDLAIQVAERFLASIGKPDKDIAPPTVSVDWMDVTDRTGKSWRVLQGYNVTYRRLIDGYTSTGPGGRIRVFLDRNVEVVGYLRVWRELTPYEKFARTSVSEAVDSVKRNPLGHVTLGGVRWVEVNDIELAYLEWGTEEAQRYIQPVYVFHCTAHGDSWEAQYVRYQEAIDCSPEPIWPPDTR